MLAYANSFSKNLCAPSDNLFYVCLHALVNHGRVGLTPHSTGKTARFHKATFYVACTPQAANLTVIWAAGQGHHFNPALPHSEILPS